MDSSCAFQPPQRTYTQSQFTDARVILLQIILDMMHDALYIIETNNVIDEWERYGAYYAGVICDAETHSVMQHLQTRQIAKTEILALRDVLSSVWEQGICDKLDAVAQRVLLDLYAKDPTNTERLPFHVSIFCRNIEYYTYMVNTDGSDTKMSLAMIPHVADSLVALCNLAMDAYIWPGAGASSFDLSSLTQLFIAVAETRYEKKLWTRMTQCIWDKLSTVLLDHTSPPNEFTGALYGIHSALYTAISRNETYATLVKNAI
jgi:hypothetical protein